MTLCTIRPTGAADIPAVLQLASSLSKWFTPQAFNEMPRDFESHGGFVALRRGHVVGFLTWNPLDDGVANLSWMSVSEELQHTGIGTALLGVLAEALRADGYRWLEVSTVADSVECAPYAETRRFYRARGFEDYRVDEKYFGTGDDRYDRLLLRLDLNRAVPAPHGKGA